MYGNSPGYVSRTLGFRDFKYTSIIQDRDGLVESDSHSTETSSSVHHIHAELIRSVCIILRPASLSVCLNVSITVIIADSTISISSKFNLSTPFYVKILYSYPHYNVFLSSLTYAPLLLIPLSTGKRLSILSMPHNVYTLVRALSLLLSFTPRKIIPAYLIPLYN